MFKIFKIFKYFAAIKAIIKGIEKAKEDGVITIDEIVKIFVTALDAAQLGHVVVYDDSIDDTKKSND